MDDADRNAFRDLMQQTAAYYDRRLAGSTLTIYWRGLVDLPLATVSAAIGAHVQDPVAGQYMPKIADIRRAIRSAAPDDGHLGSDEAWALALPAQRESSSVVWTEQMAAAFLEAAMPLLEAGDKVAARKAFQERYDREVEIARRTGIAARWVPSLGSDPAARDQALARAVAHNRITADYAASLLPAPRDSAADVMLALEDSAARATDPDAARAQLRALKRLLLR